MGFTAGMTMGESDSSRIENKIFGREQLRGQVVEELFKWILKSQKYLADVYGTE